MKRILILGLALGFFVSGCGDGPQEAESSSETTTRDNEMIGLTLSEAEKIAIARGLLHRVTMLDGKLQPATRDLRENRVNFVVEEGKVVGVSRG